ncbi:recombination protein RecR [Spiroplasma corruscae]|uniref:Recombination protein RecR n=1 Tax=Spiroplasma corruscae TaxID=216934 RepID=A0A222EMM8_9MOLU|nr:toprim domain-containing protein [Spiroplasma corruscae]ASP27782.1 recombination protein RecR [Spiroplasma corruscae]
MDDLLDKLKEIDGITNKIGEKFLINLIENLDKFNLLNEILQELKENYKNCEICNFYKMNNTCVFCDNNKRDQNLVCVLTSKREARKLLNSEYRGIVHILRGEINLNKNISPDTIQIDKLFARINKDTEVLLATNLTFNGEVTANYIISVIKDKCKKITRLARGIPFGGSLDYIDEETLINAIENRKIIKK